MSTSVKVIASASSIVRLPAPVTLASRLAIAVSRSIPVAAVATRLSTVMSVPAAVPVMAPPEVRFKLALFAGLIAPRTVIVPLLALPIAIVPAVI